MGRARWAWWIWMIASGCDVDVDDAAREVSRRDPGVGRTPPEPDPCRQEHGDWIGCPGMPCAHGWCFVGECRGEVVAPDGELRDPGICCADDECLAD